MSTQDIEPPPYVVARPGSLGDVPVKTGRLRVLGLRVPAGRESPFYFLARPGWWGRYRRRFPCTEEGWSEAWAAFAREDPDAALAYVDALNAPVAAEPVPTSAPVQATGWSYIGGGFLVMVVAALIQHTGVSGAVVGALIGSVGLVFLLIGIVAEGVRLGLRGR